MKRMAIRRQINNGSPKSYRRYLGLNFKIQLWPETIIKCAIEQAVEYIISQQLYIFYGWRKLQSCSETIVYHVIIYVYVRGVGGYTTEVM